MKIAVAMSGGIDSTVAAILLHEEGHEIVGITAGIFNEDLSSLKSNFLHPERLEEIHHLSERFGFEHHLLNITEDFDSLIIEPFCREYLRGRTPNPCIRCNPAIKFRSLESKAKELGCDRLATGHYASIIKNGDRYTIRRGKDTAKDQSYFLYRLSQETLSFTLFPLGDYTKDEIREIARKRKIESADSQESQEICFIPDNDYASFIEKRTNAVPLPGDIIDQNGDIIGKHSGIHKYTIGQRRGLGISAPNPLYVKNINASDNTITAGYIDELYTSGFIAVDPVYMKISIFDNCNCLAKIRSTQPPVRVMLHENDEEIRAIFQESQTGVSPGQSAVFYDDNGDVLGGAIIDSTF